MAHVVQAKKRYPVRVREFEQKYVTFRYDFVPASVEEKDISLVQAGSGGSVQIHKGEVTFKGKMEDSEKDTDCILIFDPENECFYLERLEATISQLRPIRKAL